MPAESQAEQIVEALKDSLEAISGGDYHYPPDSVIRASYFSEACLRESVGDPAVIYALIPDVYPFDEQTFSDTAAVLELDLVLARRYHVADEDPFNPPSPTRWQVQHRMIHDVITKLRGGDKTLGGLALHLRFTLADIGAEETFEDTWALAFLRLEVDYDFTDGNP